MPQAAYDEIADRYEREFLAAQRARPADDGSADSLGIDRALLDLLGTGRGLCLDVGCGTGIYAARIAALGWTPIGVDLSAGMLRHARDRRPSESGRDAAPGRHRLRPRRGHGDGPRAEPGDPGPFRPGARRPRMPCARSG